MKDIDNIRPEGFKPKAGIVLGSGLGGLTEKADVISRVSYSEIKGFPSSTVEGHSGEYVFGHLEGVPVIMMNGRVHYYEGYPMKEVVRPVMNMALMGADTIILTNAAGGINRDFSAGTLMCINDQITSFIPSPLIGRNDEYGVRFPDMSEVYDKSLIKELHNMADRLGIGLADGVYLQTTGPQYETPAEVRMFERLGADAVGMSTACEAMVLNRMGIRLAGISCITNMACGISDAPLSHEEVQATADRVGGDFIRLITEFVKEL